jgi:predicted N-formylglutamate amidohydrolase
MPAAKPALEDVGRLAVHPGQFVISAEHATNRIPAAYNNLGLSGRQLQTHIAWDPGAGIVARACARALGCPCHPGHVSRLLVDLNRSLGHSKLMARRSFSIAVPGNRDLSPAEKERRIRLYYRPFREAVLSDVRRAIEEYGRCIHLSIHSFTPVVGRVVRHAEIGLLYDPHRPLERLVADELLRRLSDDGFHVRRNYPYRGVSDGHTTHLRRDFRKPTYAGVEIEVNQRLLKTGRGTSNVARRLAQAIQWLTH